MSQLDNETNQYWRGVKEAQREQRRETAVQNVAKLASAERAGTVTLQVLSESAGHVRVRNAKDKTRWADIWVSTGRVRRGGQNLGTGVAAVLRAVGA